MPYILSSHLDVLETKRYMFQGSVCWASSHVVERPFAWARVFVGMIEIGLENGEKLLSLLNDRSFQIIMKC